MAQNTTPGPVVNAAAVGSFLSGIVLILGFLGFSPQADALDGQSKTIVSIVVGLVTVVPALLGAFRARDKVTPVANPHSATSVPLAEVASPTPVLNPLSVQVDALPVAAAAAVSGDNIDLPDGQLPVVPDDDENDDV